MDMTLRQADAVRRSRKVRKAFRRALSNKKIIVADVLDLTFDEIVDLYDAAQEVIDNHAPVVQQFTAEQDKGAYNVTILGIPGAYFVDALEFDRRGFFPTLAQARREVMADHGEFLVPDAS